MKARALNVLVKSLLFVTRCLEIDTDDKCDVGNDEKSTFSWRNIWSIYYLKCFVELLNRNEITSISNVGSFSQNYFPVSSVQLPPVKIEKVDTSETTFGRLCKVENGQFCKKSGHFINTSAKNNI